MRERTPLRRQPRQERGERRIAAILDAAVALFAEVGYEAATTNEIARRARTSIGSLYQFFPNKEAILEAVTARFRDKLRAVHDAIINEATARLPLTELYDRVIDALAEFHAANPGFRALFHGPAVSRELAAAEARLRDECVRSAELMIATRHPELPPARCRLYAAINVDVVRALLPLAEAGEVAPREVVLAEIKRLLSAHMREAIQAAAPAP
jgi:AcrR family transcriptional regulator